MKKLLFSTIVLLTVAFQCHAQGFYIRGGLGYAFPEASQTIDAFSYPYNGSATHSGSNVTYALHKASLSSGFQGTVAGGYMFTRHIGVDLALGVGLANTKYKYNNNNDTINSVPSNETITQYASTPVFLMPSVVLQTGDPVWNFYCRFGIVLPLSSQVKIDDYIVNEPGTGAITPEDITSITKTYFSVGFTGALGVNYNFNNHVSLWGEISLLSLSLYAKEMDLQDITVNGTSYLSQIPGPSRTVQYQYNVTSNNTSSQQPTYSLPFSNIGINIGIKYTMAAYRRTTVLNEDDAPEPKHTSRSRR